MTAAQTSIPAYISDAVSGLTQAPFHFTVQQFLNHFTPTEFAVCYVEQRDVVTGESAIIPVDHAKLKRELGIDPFSITNNDPSNPYVARLCNEYHFVFGFKACITQESLSTMKGLRYSLRWLYFTRDGNSLPVLNDLYFG